MTKKKPIEKIDYNSIPREIELFGRKIITVDHTDRLNKINVYGEARYGSNEIAMSYIHPEPDHKISIEEIKLTYLHEMFHFILNFTGYENILKDTKIDIEQFIELISSAIYQYEKTRKY
jgi:hypothetical protein